MEQLPDGADPWAGDPVWQGEIQRAAIYQQQQDRDLDEIVQVLLMELTDESALEEDEEQPKHGGSVKGRATNKNRDFAAAYAKLVKDYFSGHESTYDETDFERRFRMPRAQFNLVYEKINGTPPFVQYYDATGKPGIHPLCRFVACLRYLSYGDAFDREDENLRLSEESLRMSVVQFEKLVVKHFGELYLNRCPSDNEKRELVTMNARRGFPGLLASWDCKHFVWHKCPTRLAGQHKGHAEGGRLTLILEAIADANRYIWFANFGDPGSLNDINVLDKSSIVGAMMDGSFDLTTEPYTINGTQRDWLYFLADGIYPDWAIFVKTYSDPVDDKENVFATRQEAVRKDVECAFGMLVQKFQVLQRPLRKWYQEDIRRTLHCCVILYNMSIAMGAASDYMLPVEEAVVEVRNNRTKDTKKWPLFGGAELSNESLLADNVNIFAARVAHFSAKMQSETQHFKLKDDLREHLYHGPGA